MSRRTPARRRSTRSHRSSVQAPAPAQLAAAIVGAVAPELEDADPLQAQLVASWLAADRLEQHWAALDRAGREQGAEPPRPALGLVRLLTELREPTLREAGLALVLALASLDPEDDAVQEAAVEAVRRFRFLGTRLPGWAEHVLMPELTGAWCVRDVFSESMTVYVGARFAVEAGTDDAAHCIAARIEQGRFPELVEVFLAEAPDVLLPQVEQALADDPEASLLRLEQLPLARAGALLWDVITDVEESGGESLEDDAFECFALLEARAALLGPLVDESDAHERDQSPHDSELDGLEPHEVVERFLASDEYVQARDAHEQVAHLVVAWATSQLEGAVARVGPAVALELLSDLSAAAVDEPDRELLARHGIPTVQAWCLMCGRITGLPDDALGVVRGTLERAREEFERLVLDTASAGSGLGDQLMELMLEDGVDVGRQEELDAWSERWNGLTDQERMARLDALR